MLKKMFLSLSFALTFVLLGAVSGFAQGANVITNGDFLSGSSGWATSATGVGSSVTFPSGYTTPPLVGTTSVLRAQSTGNTAVLSQSSLSLTSEATYRLAIGYSTSRTDSMTFEVKISDGVTDLIYSIPLNTTVTDLVRDFTIPSGFGSATITFTVTNSSGLSRFATVDNISLTKLQ